MAHNIIKEGSIAILKRLQVMAKLLLSSSEVNEEKKNLVPAYPGVSPLDILLSPNSNFNDPTMPIHCTLM